MDHLVHTHFLLEGDQRSQLRTLAAERGRSMGVLVREAVGQYLRAEVGPTAAQRRNDARYVVGSLPIQGASESGISPTSPEARPADQSSFPPWWPCDE
jgi:hypothetical protein